MRRAAPAISWLSRTSSAAAHQLGRLGEQLAQRIAVGARGFLHLERGGVERLERGGELRGEQRHLLLGLRAEARQRVEGDLGLHAHALGLLAERAHGAVGGAQQLAQVAVRLRQLLDQHAQRGDRLAEVARRVGHLGGGAAQLLERGRHLRAHLVEHVRHALLRDEADLLAFGHRGAVGAGGDDLDRATPT